MNRKPKTNFYLSHGNHKLSSKIIIFTLPSGITCPGKGECAKWCYSKKAEKLYPACLNARLRNLKATKQPDFEQQMISALQYEMKLGRYILRLHEDGDLYCQSYLDTWKRIAKQLPKLTVFAFTKSFHLDLWTNLPKNFIIIQSFGSHWDGKIDKTRNTARVIERIEQRTDKEYVCPYHKLDFTKCGEYCEECMNKRLKVRHIVFLKH